LTTTKLAIGTLALGVLSCLAVIARTDDAATQVAVVLAALIGTSNALCALWLARLGAGQASNKAFFGAVFGGMFLRMTTALGGFIIGLRILALPAAPFSTALLLYTVFFMALEVAAWSRRDFSPGVQTS
jgi:hypothetical protein